MKHVFNQFGNETHVFNQGSSLCPKHMFLIKVQVYARNPGKNVSYPGKKYPDQDQQNFPTRPHLENILKNGPRPRAGFGPVRGNLGFRVTPQVFTLDLAQTVGATCVNDYIILIIYALSTR